jgi:carboxyl-terminal processing protease
MKLLRSYLILIFAINVFAADSTNIEFARLSPEPQHKKVAPIIVKYLENFHYQKRAIDDSMSAETFDRYFEKLDPARMYFLRSDLVQFEKYRYVLDDYIRIGFVDPAYEIFTVYEQRIADRLEYVYKRLEKPFDFSKEEFLDLDYNELPRAISRAELDERWRKRLKNEALNLKLSGKEWDETVELLIKRYRRFQKNVSQFQSEDVFQTLMNSFTECFDPHTSYFSPKIFDDFKIQMSQAYSGIGARLQSEDDYTVVREIIPGGPADKSKLLHADDKIVGVGQDIDGEVIDVVGWRIDDVVQLIRGEKETTVRLDILPAGSAPGALTDTIAIIRDKIKLEDASAEGRILKITSENRDFYFGVIEIPQFYSDFEGRQSGEKNYKGTTNDVRRILTELGADTLDGVVIDLRRNGGGYLNEAIDLTGLFVGKGPVVQVRNAAGKIAVEWNDRGDQFYAGPLAVLVDRISASASEIFAAAIQDYNRGLIIGSQTFGKGTVQNPVGLNRFFPNTKTRLGQLKITTMKFYRINGGSTQHIGVIPDISFPSRFELMDIGESSEPNALLWDQIAAVKYKKFSDFDMVVPKLEIRHNLRISADPEYATLLKDMDEIEKNRNKKQISLNYVVRKKEREEADAKKKARLGKDPEEDDLLLLESARVLSDYIMISKD